MPWALRPLVPIVAGWAARSVAKHKSEARSVASFEFPRLDRYFPQDLLERSYAVITDDLPVLPFPRNTPVIRRFPDQFSAITFGETYFIRPHRERDEGLHFHELIHVVQYEIMGLTPFFHAYGVGVMQGGYFGCPLEAMAYQIEGRFSRGGEAPFDAVEAVRVEIEKLYG
ncbi:MAG: hypothetical protein RLY93_08605 [Sumerlaeia bacterium]